MFLRAKVRHKDGKPHRYFSVVENRRVGRKRVAQRTVLYLGEIHDSQEGAWRKTLEVFDEGRREYSRLSLFPDDREIPAEAANSIQGKLSEMELRRARAFGNCWRACERWRQLQLEEFWRQKLAGEGKRETVPWEKVLRLLVVNRLIDPGSEFRAHRQWFDQSAMGELLEADFAVAEKDPRAEGRPRGDAREGHLPGRQNEAGEGGVARWPLSAAVQSGGGRSGGAVGTVWATDAD